MFSSLKNTLDQGEIQYTESENLTIICPANNGLEVQCFISEPAEFGGHIITEFWAIADLLAPEEALELEHYEDLLKETCTWPLGAWCLRNMAEGTGLCFSIKLLNKDENLSAEKIQLALNGVSHVVATMQEAMGMLEA